MKIEKDNPLPDHTKINYEECCAKLILEELISERYSKLLLSDKPDLQGRDVGIEVTSANNRNMEEAKNNWVKANNCTNKKKIVRCVERMAQLGVEYTGGVQVWPNSKPTFDLVGQTIVTKIQKLKKGNYNYFNRYELFVFTDTWLNDEVINEAKQFLFDKSVSNYYKTVYVFSQGSDLHLFETCEKTYMRIEVDYAEQNERNRRARKMVEEAEETEI